MSDISLFNVLSKFANSFDLKDWQGLKSVLASSIMCDYQALRNDQQTLTNTEYVELRKIALAHLRTQHLFSNFEILLVKDNRITCRVSALILRENQEGITFNTHAIYEFGLIQVKNNKWKIDAITQKVLWNEGEPSIHPGVK